MVFITARLDDATHADRTDTHISTTPFPCWSMFPGQSHLLCWGRWPFSASWLALGAGRSMH